MDTLNENKGAEPSPTASEDDGPFSPLIKKLSAILDPVGRYLDHNAANPTLPFKLPAKRSRWAWIIFPVWLILLILLAALKWFAIAVAICIPLFLIIYSVGYTLDVTGLDTLITTVYPFAVIGTPIIAPLLFVLARKLTEGGPSRIASIAAMTASVLVVISVPIAVFLPLVLLAGLVTPYIGNDASMDLASKAIEFALGGVTAYLITKPWRWSLRKPARATPESNQSSVSTQPADEPT